jgi:Na+/melibiose symporter-like transporter
MLKRIFLVISLLLLVRLGWDFFAEYNFHHTYYNSMLESRQNWKVTLVGLIFGLIPVCYLLFAKHKSWWGTVGTLALGLVLFCISYVAIKADLF